MRKLLPASLVLLAVGACAPAGSGAEADPAPAAFDFATLAAVDVQVRVEKHGQALAGASIDISAIHDDVDGDSAQQALGQTFFQGGTDAGGLCRAQVPLPTAVREVDVTVHHAGSRGPYSDEQLRAKWGPFAPSSRVRVSVEALTSLTVELEDL